MDNKTFKEKFKLHSGFWKNYSGAVCDIQIDLPYFEYFVEKSGVSDGFIYSAVPPEVFVVGIKNNAVFSLSGNG